MDDRRPIVVDFDFTVAVPLDVEDPLSELQLQPGAYDALLTLKKTGRPLVLFSGRANRALREDPNYDPLIRAGVIPLDLDAWQEAQPMHQARYQQMLDFVAKYLPNVFDAIDDGRQGKPQASVFIDDKGRRFKTSDPAKSWEKLAEKLGD